MHQYLPVFVCIVHSEWVLTFKTILCFFTVEGTTIAVKLRQAKEGSHTSNKEA